MGIIVGLITAMCTTGGILYLVVEKLFARKKDKVEVDHEIIGNGNEVADLYEKIDSIVERKTSVIRAELEEVKKKLEDISSNWVCYREDCTHRVLKKSCPKNKIIIE